MSKEVMKLALEALETERNNYQDWDEEDGAPEYIHEAITALRQALEQPAKQEPVAAECKFEGLGIWGRCSVEHHNLVQSEPHNWPGYQTRLLYTSPQPAQQEPVASIFISGIGEREFDDWEHDLPVGRNLLYTSPPARQEPAFHGFMDEERCCVNICYTPWAPGGPNNELPTAYYTSPPAQRKPLTDEQAYEIGAKGGEPSEAERLLFEAWMRGHCWAVIGEWDGKTYVHAHESSGFVHGGAMTTRQLWAAWRDRAALEAAHGIKENT